jgi:Skp family chaperone for outer membrane proteins
MSSCQKTKGFMLYIGVLLLVFVSTQAYGEALSIGFVDLDKIREGYKRYQDSIDKIKQVKEKEQVTLDEMSSTFDKNVKAYELKEGLFATEEQKQTELEDLRKKWNILNEFKAGKDQELEKKSREELGPLVDKIKTTIKDVAASNGYHLIFKQSDLAYSDPRLDITDKVLAVLNKE